MRYVSVITVAAIGIAVVALVLLRYRAIQHQRLRNLRDSVTIICHERDMHRERRRIYHEVAASCDTDDPDESMFRAAQLYKRGVWGSWSPCPDVADALCRSLVLHGRDADLRTEAMQLLYEPHVAESLGPPLPPDLAERVLYRFRTRPQLPPSTTTITPATTNRVDTHHPEPRTETPRHAPPRIRSDSQNSHQHTVVASTRKVLDNLPGVNDTDIIRTVESYIQSETDPLITDETKAKALHALDSINTIESAQFNGLTEQQALARVWNHTKPEERDMVVQQLASAIEHGQPVCHTGKMTRLASTVGRVIPTWQVKEMLQSEAARIRDTTLENATASEKRDYMEHDDAPLKDAMVREFRDVASATMDREGFDASVLQPTVDAIIDHGF